MFADHLTNPSAISAEHATPLENLVQKFPYSQILRSFYVRSLSNATSFEKELSIAAIISPDRNIIRVIIEDPESLKEKDNEGQGLVDIEHILTEKDEPIQEEEFVERSQHLFPKDDIEEREHELAVVLLDSIVLDEGLNNLNPEPEEQAIEKDELDFMIKQNAVSVDFLTQDVIPAEQQNVSRYNDDKLPYSFLWWLNKTRKEHSETYQPYVSFQLDTSQSIKRNTVDQLSSQIIENIFHLQSPVDELENAPRTVPFQVRRKEDYILEKFIREEPQIKPPNSEKLDTENKARKSAEDPNDLVSETLAQIYTDQMLFHKAVETYKKLSLKFPEKSTYFADQIQELEKKIN